MLSLSFCKFPVGIKIFVIQLSRISSLFSYTIMAYKKPTHDNKYIVLITYWCVMQVSLTVINYIYIGIRHADIAG